MTSKTPVGVISVVTLIRTDTTLDHSQKAEKVCWSSSVEERMLVWQVLGAVSPSSAPGAAATASTMVPHAVTPQWPKSWKKLKSNFSKVTKKLEKVKKVTFKRQLFGPPPLP